ncbi:MAG: hypothetical protein WBV61_04975 [Rhodanobacteraceae bacterium]
MIRILEVFVALLIVAVLAVVVAVFLPAHGHIERSVEVSSPVRQIYDSLNTFNRFPQWSALRALDRNVQMTFHGPQAGEGAQVAWTSSSPKVGDGDLKIDSSEQDSKITMGIDNDWDGANKVYTITLDPATNGKTVKITWAYDVDYGWNLLWRYAGLYIHGDPATHIQVNLNNVAAMLASFPNVDYKDQQISLTDVTAKPIFLVSTKAPRTLDDVASATDAAMNQIEAAMKKAGLNAAGPRMTITTNWGEDNYVFDVAVPVDATSFKLGDQQVQITPAAEDEDVSAVSNGDSTAQEASATTDQDNLEATPAKPKPGSHDDNGYLVVDDNVRAVVWYEGKALVTDYTGNPAALPLLRRMEKAYADTHGFPHSEIDTGRAWDELTSPPDTAQDQQTYKVYLPVQLPPGDASAPAPVPAQGTAVPNDGSSPPGSAAPADGTSPPTDKGDDSGSGGDTQ